ncbi:MULTISPECIES: molecular chaperone TorD family protein [Vibrio]|uniref:Molecular chaperone n=1 Tax=Vibrio casei TaxID=673372 RepID=A0A368LJF1_9VIBR|nr:MULTISPECIES: molecular chaperone TorD family protein [Vibrio]RCS70874.1 hypothetical protein CIK83_15915 [Vibrio casei]SJN40403.1 Putative oxidoreductase component of anaerobic dehydrogenases; Chaperone protein TorD [Vibrio casei]HBV76657.1 hypothetical protein [Vibrio sp.]
MTLATYSHVESALISKTLGSLFYYRPCEYSQYGIDEILNTPLDPEDASPLMQQFISTLTAFKQANIDDLTTLHDQHFSGIADIPAPPWGSVYLDRECVLFGESHTQYKQFLTKAGFEFETKNNDPLDHIGLMLMALSALLDTQENDNAIDSAELQEMLSVHLLPWSHTYLSNVSLALTEPSYSSLVKTTQTLLEQYTKVFLIPVENRKIYIQIDQDRNETQE